MSFWHEASPFRAGLFTKLITFDNSFYRKNISILKLESLFDIDRYFSFYFDKTFKEIKVYLSQIKPSHVRTTTALSASVTSINRLNSMLRIYKVDMLSEEDKNKLNLFTDMYFRGYSKLYKNTLMEVFEKYGYVMLNGSGAIFLGEIEEDYNNSNIEITDINNLLDMFEPIYFNLENDSKFLILENDPEPDKWYKDNISEKYSSILNLREVIDKGKLEYYLKEYIYAGFPKKIFVYTTGNDIEQMKVHISKAKKLKFDIEIFFNDNSLKNDKENLMKNEKISYKFLK